MESKEKKEKKEYPDPDTPYYHQKVYQVSPHGRKRHLEAQARYRRSKKGLETERRRAERRKLQRRLATRESDRDIQKPVEAENP